MVADLQPVDIVVSHILKQILSQVHCCFFSLRVGLCFLSRDSLRIGYRSVPSCNSTFWPISLNILALGNPILFRSNPVFELLLTSYFWNPLLCHIMWRSRETDSIVLIFFRALICWS